MAEVIIIDPSKVPILREEGGQLVVNAKAEDAIIKLWELESAIQEAWDYIKSEIEINGLRFDKNFSSVEGDRVKANYSASGVKYKVEDPKLLESLPEELVIKEVIPATEERIVYKLAGAGDIDKYIKQNGGELPNAIKLVDRKKNINLKLKKGSF